MPMTTKSSNLFASIALAIFVVGIVFLTYKAVNQRKVSQPKKEMVSTEDKKPNANDEANQIIDDHPEPITININRQSSYSLDQTEDARGIGYTGQRKVVVTKQGNILVGYRKKYQGSFEVFASMLKKNDEGYDQNPVSKSVAFLKNNTNQRVPSIFCDKQDQIYLTWYGADKATEENNRQTKFTKTVDNSETWGQWKNISPVAGYNGDDYWQEHPYILKTQAGKLIIVWEGKDQENQKQQVKISFSDDNGSTWTDWKNVQEVLNKTQSRPTMVEDSKGRLHLVMYSSANNDRDVQQIQYAYSDDQGSTWSPWQAISDPAFDARHASLAADDQGGVYAVWRSSIAPTGPTQIIFRKWQDGQWQNQQLLSGSKNYQFFPSIGIIESSHLPVIAWMESAASADYPREEPGPGAIQLAVLKDSLVKTINVCDSNTCLYPNLPEKIPDSFNIPMAFVEQKNTGYAVKVDLFAVE